MLIRMPSHEDMEWNESACHEKCGFPEISLWEDKSLTRHLTFSENTREAELQAFYELLTMLRHRGPMRLGTVDSSCRYQNPRQTIIRHLMTHACKYCQTAEQEVLWETVISYRRAGNVWLQDYWPLSPEKTRTLGGSKRCRCKQCRKCNSAENTFLLRRLMLAGQCSLSVVHVHNRKRNDIKPNKENLRTH